MGLWSRMRSTNITSIKKPYSFYLRYPAFFKPKFSKSDPNSKISPLIDPNLLLIQQSKRRITLLTSMPLLVLQRELVASSCFRDEVCGRKIKYFFPGLIFFSPFSPGLESSGVLKPNQRYHLFGRPRNRNPTNVFVGLLRLEWERVR